MLFYPLLYSNYSQISLTYNSSVILLEIKVNKTFGLLILIEYRKNSTGIIPCGLNFSQEHNLILH
jgi:hypothetical protein